MSRDNTLLLAGHLADLDKSVAGFNAGQAVPPFFRAMFYRIARHWRAALQTWLDMHVATAGDDLSEIAASNLLRVMGVFLKLEWVADTVTHTRAEARTAGQTLQDLKSVVEDAAWMIHEAQAGRGQPHPALVDIEMTLLNLLVVVISEQRALAAEFRERPAPDRHVEITQRERDAIRMREVRRRKRMGVRHRIKLDLLTGEIELLRRYGFMRGRDWRNADDVAEAMKEFMAVAFLTYRDQSVTTAERLDREHNRLAALNPTDDNDIDG